MPERSARVAAWSVGALVVALLAYLLAYAIAMDRTRPTDPRLGVAYRSSWRWARTGMLDVPMGEAVKLVMVAEPGFANRFFAAADWSYWRLRGEDWRQVRW